MENKQNRWHWLLICLFSLFVVASFSQQLLLIALLLLIVALIKGPGLLVWGAIYTFLISLFPPLGVVLTTIFFLLNLHLLTKSWRVNMVSSWFYLYPFVVSGMICFLDWQQKWQLIIFWILGIVVLMFLLNKAYLVHQNVRQVAWTVLATPFEILLLALPKKITRKFKMRPEHKI
ncbi:hypothetical protein KUA55_10585 [Enterococcus sp. ALS3]|uniref:DUF2232 domain-containing protein n=1 Tax=Enterococcus alishanensis TaxID=1303817 RepID=A0ABS6TDW7_9ENTE|nr:hypothetical protein [Enterococcus alishanensis]MBV7391128.1 hypothetical protein [Enterococcus alishanensis]